MTPYHAPNTPLVQVVFAYDYLQLVFENDCFTIYHSALLRTQTGETQQGCAGFADGVIGLIGSCVVSCETEPFLKLCFETGAEVVVLTKEADVHGPKAFEYRLRSNNVYVID